MATNIINWPQQQLSFKAKNKKWRKENMDYFDIYSWEANSAVRHSVHHKKINYDLLNGKIHMSDLEQIVNPDGIQAEFIPEKIQHYPILNPKLRVLQGEEAKRLFDFKVVVTNPNSITEIENTKKQAVFEELQALITNQNMSEEEYNAQLEKLNQYYIYEYQDLREIKANALLNHYSKEQNFSLIFNEGFVDAMTVAEEIYQCDIVGKQPVLQKLDPLTVRVIRSGYSNRIEDADAVVIEEYWAPGRIIDYYYDSLKPDEVKYIINASKYDSEDIIDPYADPTRGFIRIDQVSSLPDNPIDYLFGAQDTTSKAPYDSAGNVKVLRAYWKSRRKIKQVKSYDPETGEEVFTFYPETYQIDKTMGEEEKIFWVNEAWEGTKIGKDIYVNIRPRPIQYNTLDNPSKCHFGIIGTIYTTGNQKAYSLIDMMKPYSYLYDVIHDRLNKLIAHNYGKLVELDLAKKPSEWSVEKWLYFAKVNNLAVIDSFNEGRYGSATGKLAGALNNASRGAIDADQGNTIQQYMNLLEFLKAEMSEVAGISRQREGQISNRETVGGVERATLQSSHITEWLFIKHEDVKKRVLECFLETAKIAMKTGHLKFQYILPDFAQAISNIDGDEFAESDYGLVVDTSAGIQELSQKLDMLVQAGLQNQMLNFSTVMKIYQSCSMAEKIRMVEKCENDMQQRQQQDQQLQQQMAQQQIQAQQQQEQMRMEHEDMLNERDNETKIVIAQINSETKANDGVAMLESSLDKEKLLKDMQILDEKMQLERDKFNHQQTMDKERLAFDKDKAAKEQTLKSKQISKQLTHKNNG